MLDVTTAGAGVVIGNLFGIAASTVLVGEQVAISTEGVGFHATSESVDDTAMVSSTGIAWVGGYPSKHRPRTP